MKIQLQVFKSTFVLLLTLVAGLVIITLNNVGPEITLFTGDLGDSRFNLYILEHGYKFLTGQLSSYWNAPFMVPEKSVISYSDNLLGVLPFYAVFRFFGWDTLSSFQGWFIFMVCLNFICAYYFLNWLFKNFYAAALGAFVFAFSIALQSQMTHVQTFGRFPVPLVIWTLLMFSEDLKLKYLFYSLMLFVYQMYCGIYLGLLLFIPYCVIVILVYRKNGKQTIPLLLAQNSRKKLLACFLIPLGFLLPLFIPYIQRSGKVGASGYNSIVETIPVLKSYFYSQKGSLFWDGLSNVGGEIPAFWDHQLFPGAVAILSILVLFYHFFRSTLKMQPEKSKQQLYYLCMAALITFICFIRIQKFSAYWVIHLLPGFGAMRSMTRIVNIELLFFSIAVGYLFVVLCKNRNKVFQFILYIFLLAILVADNYVSCEFTYHTAKDFAQERVTTLMQKMEHIPKGSLVSYEPLNFKGNPVEFQLDAMLASQALNLKCVNGYSATSPPEFTDFWNNLDEKSRIEWFKAVEFNPDTLYVIR